MFLRVVRARLAPGQFEAYWAWAGEILQLWDAHGIRRLGGPYRHVDPNGDHIAIWLTAHETEAGMRDEFREMYASGRGAELIALRPPLVAETTVASYPDWGGEGTPPDTPSLA